MERRALLLTLLAAAVPALPQTRQLRIAFLHPGSQQANRTTFDALRTGLKDLGYAEAREILIDARWANGRVDRLPALAAELVALKPDVIVTATSAAVAACRQATSSIPIVFAAASNPVEQGFVASLSRPGGNVTGIVLYTTALAAKNAELAREALPGAQRLAILVHDADPVYKSILETFVPGAQRFKFEPLVVRVSGAEDLERAFRELRERRADAVYLPEMNFMVNHRARLVELSLKGRLPLLSNNDDITLAGGLLSYGTTREENYRRAAVLVDKILRGAKPADIAVEQPERFQLVINRKTARAIGVVVSPLTSMRADRYID